MFPPLGLARRGLRRQIRGRPLSPPSDSMRPNPVLLAVLATALSTSGCLHLRGEKLPAPASIPAVKGKPTTAFALQWIDVTLGTGEEVTPRGCVYAHYTGWLTDGTKFDSSRDTTARGT